ncbi:hypothetical protein [Streptomyces telluris]|uniref:Uncharacterized protein n=1 Tax=Streptomyces telluris TaxID=2720021 RepID=A0A9X2RPZ4_9ACTN|nr:hypothetical protein [Streptomyces telluris]MCQ8774447.1 hypothetical protein [Streptomyces telluris]NJP80590.1 hypothetical protein [Streptomyces telluris]
MIRHALRPTGALAATAVLVLGGAALAAPARAVSSCRVNGVPVAGPFVRGTDGDDSIVCADGVDAETTVDALGGADTITLTGAIGGVVRGGSGADRVEITSGELSGGVETQEGDDAVGFRGSATIGPGGHVRTGQGSDTISVAAGGTVHGEITGARGTDRIDVHGTVARGGRVLGGPDADAIFVQHNRGYVYAGGDPGDECRVAAGDPCM